MATGWLPMEHIQGEYRVALEKDLAGIDVGRLRRIYVEKHAFTVIRTTEEGFHTGRPRYLVACTTCEVLLHEATTGPIENIERHFNNIRRDLTLFDRYCQAEGIEPNTPESSTSYKAWSAARDLFISASKPIGERDEPKSIPMRLVCPDCSELHVDEAFATKPHHTHACQTCGCVWRPAIVPTVGVRFLPGFKDQP